MLGIASAYQNLENRAKAIEYYQKALSLKPTDSDIAYYIGVLYAEDENNTAAEEYLKKSLALNKNNQKASDYLKSLQQQNNANMLNEAIALYDSQKYDESLNMLNKLLIADPMNAYGYYYRGMIYDTKENKLEAVNNFKNSLKYGSGEDLNIVNYLIAVDLDSLEKYKEAYGYYQKYSFSNAPEDEYKQYAKARLEELKQYAK
jgi:tetratricopeptide (TPR) repeat protein